MADITRLTKSQQRIYELLCDNAATLGRNWYEKNKSKYSDDLYKAYRYLRDKYLKRHDLLQEAVDMLSPADKALFEKMYASFDETSKTVLVACLDDEFYVDEIMHAI